MPDPNCHQCMNPNLKGIHTCEAHRPPLLHLAQLSLTKQEIVFLGTAYAFALAWLINDDRALGFCGAELLRIQHKLTPQEATAITNKIGDVTAAVFPDVKHVNV